MNKLVADKTALLISTYLFPLEDQTYWVDSVFEHGINLVTKKAEGSNQLIYLSAVNQEKASVIGVQLKNNQVFNQLMRYLNPGEQIRQQNHSWTVYTRPLPFKIDLVDYQSYSCGLPAYSLKLTVKDLKQLIDNLRKAKVYQQSAFNKLGTLQKYYQNTLLGDLQNDLLTNPAKTLDLVQFLFGKGLGLTPSGDDFLQGMLVMEQSLLNRQDSTVSFEQSSIFLSDLIKQELKVKATTKVSEAYYQAVLARQVNPVWLKLIEAIKNQSSDQIMQSIHSIQSYGHTSGNDMLLGAQFYLQIILKNKLLKGEV
ncbi:DUF2877 domain-containing protein [Facklamia sp. 7083-14-GEN3]|uniref:DUF2877 domain-containing protein n=1 Tax=Facklamia sp. 7083-14-GEN3 TaxID=2973478 RepID=UPI00215CE55E|nr:DUF2877 domain-containing protein [Facklamia sp. 7083-14-GEN3]MCR8969369.1 DUF2877 domain-containing protein [Facklamia sp. 7083-14-GEN3]